MKLLNKHTSLHVVCSECVSRQDIVQEQSGQQASRRAIGLLA